MTPQTLTPITYKLTELDTMIEDINKREALINTFCTMWEQRVKIQFDYAQKIRTIYAHSPLITALDQQKGLKPTQQLFMKFVQILSRESQTHEKIAEQLNEEVCKKLKEKSLSFQNQNKKTITFAKSLKKDLQSELESLEKIKHKFIKRSSEIEKYKLDYINASIIQDRDFQRKNKLYLKIKELENEIQPIKKSFETASNRYSDNLAITLAKFHELCSKVQDKQIHMVKHMKNCLMNSQIFFSGYGAEVVHETQVRLSGLNEIKVDEGCEIFRRCTRQIQQEKSFYENPFINPLQYLDMAFRKIQTSSIEQIILYGKNPEYKRELSHYFENSDGFEDFDKLKVISCYTVRIIEIFKSVFEGKQYSTSSLIQFGELIKTKPSLRKDFIFCLQKYRLDGKFKITKDNLRNIISLLKVFLDICELELDTYNSKQFMVLSFTYYIMSDDGGKIDLQFYVKSHKIWKNIKWWQCSLLESIYEEHKVKKRKSQTSSSPTFSLWDIKSTSIKKIDPTSEESSNVQNICFNQLAYYLHNMRLFDFSQNQVNTMAQKYIKLFGLSTKMANDIQLMCLNGKQDQSSEKSQKH